MTIGLSILFAQSGNVNDRRLDRTREETWRCNPCVTGIFTFLDILGVLSYGGGVSTVLASQSKPSSNDYSMG